MIRFCLVAVALVLALHCFPQMVLGAVWRVEQDGTGQFSELQPAVDAAASGDTILVGPGWYKKLTWVHISGEPIEVAAFWEDERDLIFIGEGADKVVIGPAEFSWPTLGPQVGIYGEGFPVANRVTVVGISFENLFYGVLGDNVTVEECRFSNCETGLVANGGDRSQISDAVFEVVRSTACWFTGGEFNEVKRCTLGGRVVFASGVADIRDCLAIGNQFVVFNRSTGVVENNTANCGNGEIVFAGWGADVTVRANRFSGGSVGVFASGAGTSVSLVGNEIFDADSAVFHIEENAVVEATGNDFRKSQGTDRLFVRCPRYRGAESATLNMEGNSWAEYGAGVLSSAAQISAYIQDNRTNEELMVLIDFEPFSGVPVQAENRSLGSFKALFR